MRSVWNPKARFINDIIVDKKRPGTVHIAIGNNKGPAYERKNDRSIQWDLIMTKPMVTVDGKVLMEYSTLII